MPYTVATSFDTFYGNINLGGDHRDTANGRRDDIVSKLNRTFAIVDAFSSGSIPKYTALRANADLDVMVVLNWTKHIKDKTPTAVLQDVRNALAEWRNGVRRNGQAVTLYYVTWPNVDVVPVSRTDNPDGTIMHYNVPDSNTDTWIKSRPKALAAAIEAKSTECGYNFRRIIKMIKHWNRVHSNYLRSYHIEVLALQVFSGNLDDTPWQIFQFFEKARPLLKGLLWYDTGFADDYLSVTDREQVLRRFDTAIEKSRLAWHYTYGDKSDHKSAIEVWKQIFGDQFPGYG
ncbi:MAG: SMODS domain-containing nucleotidyltransferase [Sphaerospermopsis kisseleviana]